HMRGECTCGHGECEHAAAAALVALASERDLAQAHHAARKQEAVGAWLSHLGVAAAATPEDRRGRDVVAYVLGATDGTLGVTVQRTTLLRRGGFGGSSVMTSLGDGRPAPSW